MSRTYNRKNDPKLSDLDFIWDNDVSDWSLVPYSKLLELFQDNIVLPGATEATTQYSAPSSTGFNILINDDNLDTHLILTPGTAYADGAITLPMHTNLRDKQYFIMNTTEQITNFVVNLNGAAGAHGIPSSMGADDYMTLKYDLTVNTWYRIG
jgi:hypothetical protein